MSRKRRTSLRPLWVNIHLWLGLSLGVIGIAIGLTGSVLVFDHDIDAALNPQRYVVSGNAEGLAHGEYLRRAEDALGGRAKPTMLRLPPPDGGPVVVLARAREGFARVYLDPPTGRVLDLAAGGGFLGWAHQFHENLTLREYFGREIVGAVGIAMLASSLSGLYLWWPLGRWKGVFGFRRGFTLARNLHYTCGFYGVAVLALLSFTGIYLAYPEAGRAVVARFSPVSPSLRGVQPSAEPGRRVPMDEAVAVAQSLYPSAAVAGIALPTGPRGVYRIMLREPGDFSERGNVTVLLDPKTAAVLRRADAAARTPGDVFLAWQRTLHTGEGLATAWRVVYCLAGLLPGMLAVTGTIMWLRTRKRRPLVRGMLATAMQNSK